MEYGKLKQMGVEPIDPRIIPLLYDRGLFQRLRMSSDEELLEFLPNLKEMEKSADICQLLEKHYIDVSDELAKHRSELFKELHKEQGLHGYNTLITEYLDSLENLVDSSGYLQSFMYTFNDDLKSSISYLNSVEFNSE